MVVQEDVSNMFVNDNSLENALPHRRRGSNLKSKRSSSTFNNMKFGTLKISTNKGTTKDLEIVKDVNMPKLSHMSNLEESKVPEENLKPDFSLQPLFIPKKNLIDKRMDLKSPSWYDKSIVNNTLARHKPVETKTKMQNYKFSKLKDKLMLSEEEATNQL